MLTDSAKRRVLQTLAGAFPGNALLYKWKIRTSGACNLCCAPAETQARIQCLCVALKGARISARPGSELQFFPWISENRNTNLVIKKMIKSF
jgi:hypothetical protein